MEEFIVTVIQFICLYYITKVFVKGMLILIEGKRQAKIQERAMYDEIIHRVRCEKIDDIYYWFDQDDDEFLGQGKDMETIISIVKSRFPDHVFFIQTDNDIYKIHAPKWKAELLQLKISG